MMIVVLEILFYRDDDDLFLGQCLERMTSFMGLDYMVSVLLEG